MAWIAVLEGINTALQGQFIPQWVTVISFALSMQMTQSKERSLTWFLFFSWLRSMFAGTSSVSTRSTTSWPAKASPKRSSLPRSSRLRFCVDELGSGCKGRDELRAVGRGLDERGWLGGAGNVKTPGGRALRLLVLDDMAGRVVEAAAVELRVPAMLSLYSWFGPRWRVRTRLSRLEFKLPLRLCPRGRDEGEAGVERPWFIGSVEVTRLGLKAGEMVGCAGAWSGRKPGGSGKLFGGFGIPPVLEEALRRESSGRR